MNAWTEYPEFARLVRAMKALGWTAYRCQNADRTIGLDLSTVTVDNQDVTEVQVRHYSPTHSRSYHAPHRFQPTSVKQAVDVLVALGVLPAGVRSLSAKPEPSWCLCGGPGCDGRADSPCQVLVLGGAA